MTNLAPQAAGGGGFTEGTLVDGTVASTGVALFGSIPSGTKLIMMSFQDVSINNATNRTLVIQIGDAGGIETTGYEHLTSKWDGDSATSAVILENASTSGWNLNTALNAENYTGILRFVLHDSANNTWLMDGFIRCAVAGGVDRMIWPSGLKSLSGELTQIQMDPSFTQDFDAGTINVIYQ